MKLSTVTLKDLSLLTHEVRLPETKKFHSPAFKVISYHGEYRHGADGKPDALYIMATAAAAHEAWYTDGIIIDFSDLRYEWGDNMEWVLGIARTTPDGCSYPLVIIVGDKCREALLSLLRGKYAEFCVDSLDEAVRLTGVKAEAYKQCLAQWRTRPIKNDAAL